MNYAAQPSPLPHPMASQESRERAIPTQIMRITQQSEMLRKQLEELQMRLVPLMGPDFPQMANDVGDKRPPTCDLAVRLEGVVGMIDGGNAILANMLKRLEI